MPAWRPRPSAHLVDSTLERFGRLDILVNNAGVDLAKRVTETDEADWDRLISVNLKGVFLCSKAAILCMRHHGGGVIVNVASELGIVGGSQIAAYCASKGGVVQLTKAMAVDHAEENVRVNCVCPGPVSTPLLESIIAAAPDPKAEQQSIVSKTLLKRLGRPEEIARAILFVASDEASYMTGSIVAVDGLDCAVSTGRDRSRPGRRAVPGQPEDPDGIQITLYQTPDGG